MSHARSRKQASIKTTVMILAFVLMASSVTVAQAGWTSAFLGTQIGSDDSQSEVQQKKCKKKKKKKCKKPSPGPSASASASASASPTASPSGSVSPGPSPSGSSAPKPGSGRVVEFTYTCPCTGQFFLGDPFPLENFGGGSFPIGEGEIYLSAVVNDSSGGAVPVALDQDPESIEGGRFCGATEAPLQLTPGLDVRVFVGDMIGLSLDPGVDPCPAPALSGGTITFTLSKTP